MSETENATSVAELQALVAQLAGRLDVLESQLREIHDPDIVPEDVVIAIGAACAAYLGKRATVRQVRLRHGAGWAAQGRSAIQQSHVVRHGVR